MTRREAREQAFLLLFEWSFREDETMEEIVELARHCRQLQTDDFVVELAEKTVGYAIQIDHEIERFSDKWKLGRLGRVTLAVLRMAVCEITYMQDIPAGATINEAVELMKSYATEDEASYVNGVLGAYNRALEQAENATESEQADPAEKD